jgi:hypothetical protein
MGRLILRSNRRTAVNGSLRELERPETHLAQTPRLAQVQFDRIARTVGCPSVPRERKGLT